MALVLFYPPSWSTMTWFRLVSFFPLGLKSSRPLPSLPLPRYLRCSSGFFPGSAGLRSPGNSESTSTLLTPILQLLIPLVLLQMFLLQMFLLSCRFFLCRIRVSSEGTLPGAARSRPQIRVLVLGAHSAGTGLVFLCDHDSCGPELRLPW